MTSPAHDHKSLVAYTEQIAEFLTEARQVAMEGGSLPDPACQVCLATGTLFSQLEGLIWLWRWAHIGAVDLGREEKGGEPR